jgi:hypothetical protein
MRTYHWLLTMQRSNGTSIDSATTDGIVTPEPDATRREVFHLALADLLWSRPELRGGVVVALEPDDL